MKTIVDLLESIDLTLTNIHEALTQTQLNALRGGRYRVSYYHPHSQNPSQQIVRAFTAADAITQVENTFRGMYPAPTRVHCVEPFIEETEDETSGRTTQDQ